MPKYPETGTQEGQNQEDIEIIYEGGPRFDKRYYDDGFDDSLPNFNKKFRVGDTIIEPLDNVLTRRRLYNQTDDEDSDNENIPRYHVVETDSEEVDDDGPPVLEPMVPSKYDKQLPTPPTLSTYEKTTNNEPVKSKTFIKMEPGESESGIQIVNTFSLATPSPSQTETNVKPQSTQSQMQQQSKSMSAIANTAQQPQRKAIFLVIQT